MSTHTIKGLRAEFKSVGKFHTPPELATFLRSLIPGEPDRVYDPTCGAGALLAEFGDAVEKFGQDIDAAALDDARASLVNFHGAAGDIFSEPAWIDERFAAIVANPPFSIHWEPQADERFMHAPTVPTASRADFAFLIHILHYLADDGTAAVLNFPGIAYRGGREKQLREWLIRSNFIEQVILVPGGTFTDTAISTLCLVLRKQRSTTDVTFTDRENGLDRVVTFDEIESADWSLSVQSYVHPEAPERERFDPAELEAAARRGFIRKLNAELRMSEMVASIEGWDFSGFMLEIRTALDQFALADAINGGGE